MALKLLNAFNRFGWRDHDDNDDDKKWGWWGRRGRGWWGRRGWGWWGRGKDD